MSRRRITRAQLESHLEEQLGFLERSSESYDAGALGEAKRLALTIRVLVHDTNHSKSVLGQLDRKDGQFLSSIFPRDPSSRMSYSGLLGMILPAGDYVPLLDEAPQERWLAFDDWWQEIVFVDKQGHEMSREKLVLTTANQAGGGHVDPEIDEAYARLTDDNALGWMYKSGGRVSPLGNPVRGSVRQIAHEVMRTLIPDYSKNPNLEGQMVFGGATLTDEPPRFPKVGRNDKCPCGSGQKYKRCHGKPG